MFGPSLSLCLLLSSILAGLSDARPAVSRSTNLVLRQNNGGLTQPVTVQTQNTLQTASGPMLQTCTLTFTPVTGADGEALVQEESACTVAPADSTDGSGTTPSSAAATDSAVTSVAATSSADATETASAVSSAASAAISAGGITSVGSLPTLSSVASDAASSGSPTISSASDAASSAPSGASSAAASSSPSAAGSSNASSATPAAGVVDPANGAGANPNPTGAQSSASSTSTDPSGTSAADSAASSSPPPFKLPGTTLSVLPIGLAVFAGISVIALIVVGLVTYERTKYRRAFRQRKLAESGAGMGYGGMGNA